jgi:hypothetical protein
MCATFYLTSHLICIFISASWRHTSENSIKLSQLKPQLCCFCIFRLTTALILIPRAEFLLFLLKRLFVREKWICFHAAHTRPLCVLCAAQLCAIVTIRRCEACAKRAADEKQQAGRARRKYNAHPAYPSHIAEAFHFANLTLQSKLGIFYSCAISVAVADLDLTDNESI